MRPASPPGLLRTTAAALTFLTVGACDSGPPPPRPTTITLVPASVVFDAVDDTRTFVANVRDQNGASMEGQAVTWSSSDPAVVSIDATGVARSRGPGSAVIRATAGEASAEGTVDVTQTPTTLERRGGQGQAAAAGTPLRTPLEVRLTDRLGSGVAGRRISWLVSGGGSVTPEAPETDAGGVVSVVWTLGPRVGVPQEARAVADGTGIPEVAFSATGYAGPPAELRPLAGDQQVGLVGSPLPFPLSVQLMDAFENPLTTQIAFEVTSGGGSVSPATVSTGPSGMGSTTWTLGDLPGLQRMTATASDVTFEFTAQAATSAGPPASLSVLSGDAQEGPAEEPLPQPLRVLVRDANQIGVGGVEVTFTPVEGAVDPQVATTGPSGVAETLWTLGPTEGVQEVQTSIPGLSPVTFTAQAGPPLPTCDLVEPVGSSYDIQLCYVVPVSEAVEAVFESARLRWQSLIVGDQPDLPPAPDAHTRCVSLQPAPSLEGGLLDDLVIFVVIEEIDGPFGVLGSAGPCYIRESNALTTIGTMRFDLADVERMADSGQLESVILHEMAHVIGLGTLWTIKRFLQNPAPVNQEFPGPDTHFNGPLAIAAFDAAGGQGRTVGQKVPVQNVGAGGSINGHWRESVMDRELMTPFIDGGATNPLSIVTVQSLGDLGYEVSNDQADDYAVPNPNALTPGLDPTDDVGTLLIDDILRLPLVVVDGAGRIVRILPAGGD